MSENRTSGSYKALEPEDPKSGRLCPDFRRYLKSGVFGNRTTSENAKNRTSGFRRITVCMYSKCLKSELHFRHPYKSENQTLGLDVRHFTNVSENQTQKFGFQTHFEKMCLKSELLVNLTVIECLKSILVLISDTHCTQNIAIKNMSENYTFLDFGHPENVWFSEILQLA